MPRSAALSTALACLVLLVVPVRAWIWNHLLDYETVCDPDFVVCPNGGLAFRDRGHDCVFTPCALVPAPPRPPRVDPAARPTGQWLGRNEFHVPALSVAALRRGVHLESNLRDVLRQHQNSSRPPSDVAIARLQAIVVAAAPPATRSFEQNATRRHVHVLLAALGVGGRVDHAPSMLAVKHAPWTRRAMLAQLLRFATAETVRLALRVVVNETMKTEDAAMGKSTIVVEVARKDTAAAAAGMWSDEVATSVLLHCEAVFRNVTLTSQMPSDDAGAPVRVSAVRPARLLRRTDSNNVTAHKWITVVTASLAQVEADGVRAFGDERRVTLVECDGDDVALTQADPRVVATRTRVLWRSPRRPSSSTSRGSTAHDGDEAGVSASRSQCSCWRVQAADATAGASSAMASRTSRVALCA